MGFAESHAGVDIKRVEHHGIAAPSLRDLARRGMGQRVGAADDEASEGQARVERRAAECVMARGHRRDRGCAQLQSGTAIGAFGAPLIGRRQRFLCRRRASHRRAHGEVDPVHFRHLGLPAGENALGVVRLDPALEKSGRNRKVDAFLLDAFQVHAREPACVDVLAHARAQPTFDA